MLVAINKLIPNERIISPVQKSNIKRTPKFTVSYLNDKRNSLGYPFAITNSRRKIKIPPYKRHDLKN